MQAGEMNPTLADALNKVKAKPVDQLSGALVLDAVRISFESSSAFVGIVASIDGESAKYDGDTWTVE